MKTRLLFALLLICIGISSYYLYQRYYVLNANIQLINTLFRINERDILIDRDIERMTSFKILNYDALITEIQGIEKDMQALQNLAKQYDYPQDIEQDIQIYIDKLNTKIDLLDHIKYHVSLIRNSLLYLPVLINTYAKNHPQEDFYPLSMELITLYSYYLFPNKINSEKILTHLQQIGEQLDFDIGLLIRHTTLSIEQMRSVNQITAKIADLRIGQSYKTLYERFHHYRSQSEKYTILIGLLLLFLILVLALWVSLILYRLKKLHHRLTDAVESLGEGFLLFNRDQKLILYNQMVLEFYPWLKTQLYLGITKEQLKSLKQAHIEYFDIQKTHCTITGFCNQGKTYIEFIDQERWVLTHEYPTREGGMVCVSMDITQTRQATQELQKLGRAIEQSPASIVITDVHGNIEYVNPKFEEVTGYSLEEAKGKNPRILKGGDKPPEEYKELWDTILSGREWRGIFHNRRKDGSSYWEEARIFPIKDDFGRITHFMAIKEDITQRKRDQEKILYQANYDSLTGLPNRKQLMDQLHQLIDAVRYQKIEGFALLFVDLDEFKIVNDVYGHITGDKLLTLVARRLQDSIGEHHFIARFGGDEFVILLKGEIDRAQIAHLANSILVSLSIPFSLPPRIINIRASIGITLFPQDIQWNDDDQAMATNLLSNADIAMYQAKERGKNHYQFFTASMQNKLKEQLKLEQDLNLSINNNELTVVYQPIIDIADRKIYAVEALLRWKHSQHGWIRPDVFIPLAEKTGFIKEIGDWVLFHACRQIAIWHQRYPNNKIHLAVNLSAKQWEKGFDVKQLRHILEATGLDPHYLILEITENLFLDRSEEAIQWLNELKATGIQLAVDDFGTGYSSLSYLKRFPMDELKIDKSFVQDLPEDKDDVSLVKAIMALAASLGLKVVAEGVETETQFQFLQEQHCDYIQGYLFSKPLSAEELEANFLHS